MTRKKRLYVGAVVALALLAIPQAGFGDALSLPTGSKTVSANTNWQGGVIGTTGAPTLTLNSSAVATLDAGYSLLYGTGGRWNLKGNGTLLNLGTLNYSNALNVGLSWQGSDAIFINEGLLDFIGNSPGNAGLYGYGGDGTFINTNGGVIQASSGDDWHIQIGDFVSNGGTIRATNDGSSVTFYNTYGMTNTTFETYGSGAVRLSGTPKYVHGTAVGNSVQLSSFTPYSGGTYFNVDGEGVRIPNNGDFAAHSSTVVNQGVFNIYGGPAADESRIPQGGVFENRGTVKNFHYGGTGIRPYGTGSQFHNYGTWLSSNDNTITYYMDKVTGGAEFSNMVGSVFRKMGSGECKFIQANYTFHNEGTIEVLNGYLDFENGNPAIDADTMSGGVLKLGTWKALNGAYIRFISISTDITQINTNATVILGGTSWLDEFDRNNGTGLDTLYGTLGLWAGKQYTNAAALTTDSGTTLEFGLDDSGTDAKLTLQTGTDLNAIIDVVDLGTMEAGTYTIIEMEAGQDLNEGGDGGVQIGTVTTDQELGANLTENYGDGGTIVLNVFSTVTGLQILIL